MRSRQRYLTDEQVSMLLSEAEAGWPDTFPAWLQACDVSVFPRGSALDLAYYDDAWRIDDAKEKGRDAAGNVLAALRRHGLVRP